MSESEAIRDAAFFRLAMHDLCGLTTSAGVKVLDFGCGQGRLVAALNDLGFDAWGCDAAFAGSGKELPTSDRVLPIALQPYRLPFDDDAFDIVLSVSVLEHAKDKVVCFREIHRVLRPGGCAMHLFPAKWYLPAEPHIRVPLANWFWPRCPRWWLALWARLGVRLAYQQSQPWRTVVAENCQYYEAGLSYWTPRQYLAVSQEVFGNCAWPMEFYINHAGGGFARFFRRLPLTRLSGALSGAFRMAFLLQRKPD